MVADIVTPSLVISSFLLDELPFVPLSTVSINVTFLTLGLLLTTIYESDDSLYFSASVGVNVAVIVASPYPGKDNAPVEASTFTADSLLLEYLIVPATLLVSVAVGAVKPSSYPSVKVKVLLEYSAGKATLVGVLLGPALVNSIEDI